MEGVDRSCVYGLRHQARSLTAVCGDKENNKFLVGTFDVRKDHNEVHVVTFDEERFEISSQVYRHVHEVLSLSACPARADLFFSCYPTLTDARSQSSATLWCLPNSNAGQQGHKTSLTQVFTLDASGAGTDVKDVLWDPSGELRDLVSVSDSKVQLWSLGEDVSSAKPTESILAQADSGTRVTSAGWSPHSAQVAVASETSVCGWDLRTKSKSFTIKDAHDGCVRDLDYNPNVPHQIATGGDDCAIRIWDTRNCETPLKDFTNHTHWVWSVSYNQHYDQLLLSTGSDCLVNLHSSISVSSAQHGMSSRHDDEQKAGGNGGSTSPVRKSHDKSERIQDGLVQRYDQQHEESVYCGAWSAADPWVFVTLSYDGRLVVDFVPNSYKNSILFAA